LRVGCLWQHSLRAVLETLKFPDNRPGCGDQGFLLRGNASRDIVNFRWFHGEHWIARVFDNVETMYHNVWMWIQVDNWRRSTARIKLKLATIDEFSSLGLLYNHFETLLSIDSGFKSPSEVCDDKRQTIRPFQVFLPRWSQIWTLM
jgi:hypothetical protein